MVHNGLRGHTQRYKCKDCGRRFDGGQRRDKSQVITDYVDLMPEVGKMREKKRRTFIMLLSQDDFIKENFGVADYSKEYHKEVLRRWKAHLKNNKSHHRS